MTTKIDLSKLQDIQKLLSDMETVCNKMLSEIGSIAQQGKCNYFDFDRFFAELPEEYRYLLEKPVKYLLNAKVGSAIQDVYLRQMLLLYLGVGVHENKKPLMPILFLRVMLSDQLEEHLRNGNVSTDPFYTSSGKKIPLIWRTFIDPQVKQVISALILEWRRTEKKVVQNTMAYFRSIFFAEQISNLMNSAKLL